RVPVVSFFDPDNLIERRGLGRRCRDLEDMCSTLDELLGNPDKCAAIGQRGHAAVSTQYSAREIATRYLELIERRDPVSAITGVDTPSVRAANDT
ncbi:MAG TPA: glycosyltransferase, partial [Steroidobacteraceae bacterium]